MKKIFIALGLCIMTMVFTGCTLTKQVAYFQNIDSVSIGDKAMLPEIRIKPNDELTILVSSVTPEAAEPFNLNMGSRTNTSYSSNATVGRAMYAYIVDEKGFINFPVVGQIQVMGLTRPEVEALIAKTIKPYFAETENPVVKVRFNSFKVTVIGEVGSAKVLNVDNERITLIEALAQSGDLTMYGKRPNILLIREGADGKKMTARFNLNDAKVLNSPYYFLEQNDIVYIEPHKSKARSADVSSYTFWTPISSILISLATLTISLTK